MRDIIKVIEILDKEFKERAVVEHEDPFKVLISTILSQRTKDSNTEKASKNLFSNFKNAKEIADAELNEIEKLIKPSGFFRVKARTINKVSKIILEQYNGKVPNKLEELIKLPGVGRKTANCTLCFGYKIPAIPVDVHLNRISNRIGIVKTKTPEETEKGLMKIIPKKYWLKINNLFVKFGQNICLPRKPKCQICPIKNFCEYYSTNYL